MTKKDYEKIADAIWKARHSVPAFGPEDKGIAIATDFLATALKEENPSFNRAKFYDAAGFLGRGDA